MAQRILLVEDNDANRRLLNDYLAYCCGYSVCSLADGSQFMNQVATFEPHLILLDLKLPAIDGYMLLEALQASPTYRKIPVIVVSAFAFKSDQERALTLGARQYLVKPVKLPELHHVIQKELVCSRV